MRSHRLFRNEKIAYALRPVWDSRQFRIFGRTLVTKKVDVTEPDPYEGNYSFTDCNQFTKVTVIGAAGRVGRTLSLLLKTCPLIDHLCLFDTDKSVKGIGVDISHIDTKCCVSYVCGMRNIQQALDRPDVVVIAAGCPTTPNLFGKKLFDKNAPIIAGLSEACARFCPKACVVLITNPINSLLPVMGEVYQTINNRIPSRKLFGLTTLDVVRANTFVAEVIRKNPNSVIVPVIGGTSQETIVPVISQMKPCCKIKRGEMLALTECIKRAEINLTDCQNCGTRGASSLSTAYAAFRFTSSLVMGLKGAEDIIECAFVKSDVIPELEYLASPIKLGLRGIEYNYGYPPLSDDELAGLEQAAASLINDIDLGKSFVSSVEETIRRGLIWKRITEETSKAPEIEKNQISKRDDFLVRRKRLEEGQPEGNEESPEVIEKGVVYTHSVGWATPTKTSLKSLLNSEEAPQQEMATESISAEVDGCRSDSSLHKNMSGDSDLKEPTTGEAPPTEREEAIVPEANFLRPKSIMSQTVRNIHLTLKDNTNYKERNLRRKAQEKYKEYFLQERHKIEEKQQNQPTKIEVSSVKHAFMFPPKFHENIKPLPWSLSYIKNRYKDLNLTAKQKFRSYNSKKETPTVKRFDPSASVLLILERLKKEREERSLFGHVRGRYKLDDNRVKYAQTEEDEEEDENEETKKRLRDKVMEQLRELRKENECLKKRLLEMSQEKKLESALQVQDDSVELEKTKLRACWLIMTSTMEAFSKFCKKFTSKADSELLQEAIDEIETEQEDEEEEECEDALDESQQDELKSPNHDDKYYHFLQQLMEERLETKKLRKTVSK